MKRVAFTWDETDFGMPSVYAARILVPSNFFVSAFQTLGVSLYVSQMASLFLMFFLSSILMYMFVKRITNGNVVASFVASLFLTSNLYLIGDREVTTIAFLDVTLVVLPCLLAFMDGVAKRSYKFIAFSGFLFALTFGSFPNFRSALVCLTALAMVLLLTFINKGIKIAYRPGKRARFLDFSISIDSISTFLKYSFVFILAALSISIWIMTMVWSNLGVFSQAYGQLGVTQAVLDVRLHDVLRLITKWGFYSGNLGKPYVPYALAYLNTPLVIFVSYLPPILAFGALLVSKSRKLTIFFGASAAFFLALSAGFNPFFSQFYAALASNIPLMLAFREPAQWSFFVVISFSVLIGITISALCGKFKRKTLQIIVLSLTIIVLLGSAYPLTTGDVTRNYLDTNVKGSYFPESYVELNNALSSDYWALLLPQRGTYDTYNFSGVPFGGSGNPIPLIFSKPVISGLGTEYLQSSSLDAVNEVYNSIANEELNVAPEGKASGSSVERNGTVPIPVNVPTNAFDGDLGTRWASDHGMPQLLEIEWNAPQELSKIKLVFQDAYANDYTIETWQASGWTTQVRVENNSNLQPDYTFSQLTSALKLRINFTKALPFNMVSIWEVQIYADQSGIVPKFLGMLGIKYLIFEKDLLSGNTHNVSEQQIYDNENFVLAKEWDEIALYNNTNALQKIYAADNTLYYSTWDDLFQNLTESNWGTLKHSLLLNSTLKSIEGSNTLVLPGGFTWSELSPTSFQAHMKSKGAFVLVFLESYDKNWKLTLNGKPVSETDHYEVNSYANAWLINNAGDLTVSISYEKQSVFGLSVVASIVFPVLFGAFLGRKDLKRLWRSVNRRLKPRLI